MLRRVWRMEARCRCRGGEVWAGLGRSGDGGAGVGLVSVEVLCDQVGADGVAEHPQTHEDLQALGSKTPAG